MLFASFPMDSHNNRGVTMSSSGVGLIATTSVMTFVIVVVLAAKNDDAATFLLLNPLNRSSGRI